MEKGNKIPKDVDAGSFGFSTLLDTVRAMSRTNSEVTKSHPKGDDDIEFSID